MADSSSSEGGRSLRRRRLPLVVRAALIVLVVLVVVYFGVTSAPFLRAVVLPQVGAALGGKLSAGDIALSPFSQLELRDVKVETAGESPLFQAQRIRVRYGLFSLVAGRLVFPEIVVEAPILSIVEQADGSSNLDPLLAKAAAPSAAPRTPTPPTANIGLIKLTQGAIRYTRLAPGGASQNSEITDLEVQCERLANEHDGKVTLKAAFSQTTTPARESTNGLGRLPVSLAGSFDFGLDRRLQLRSLKGDLRLSVAQATGAFKELTGLGGVLRCDVTPTEIEDVSLRFERGGQGLGAISLRGPFELAKKEARLALEITSIDRQVLNLLAAPFGLDFADGAVSATASLDVSRAGDIVATKGLVSVSRLSVLQAGKASPPVDLKAEYQVTVNLQDDSAVVYAFTATGRQSGREICRGTLDRAMYVSWGPRPEGLNESKIRLSVTDLQLRDWAMFLGTNAPSATINGAADMVCQMDGRKVTAAIKLAATNVVAGFGDYRVQNGGAQLEATATLSDYRSILVSEYKLGLTDQDALLLSVSGSAGYSLQSRDLNLQLILKSELPRLLARFPVTNLSASSGRISVDGLLAQDKGLLRAQLSLGLLDFTGTFAERRFQNHEIQIGLDVESSTTAINLRRVQINARQGSSPLGGLDVSGKYDRILEKGEFGLNIDRLSEAGLKPLLDPLLSPRQLLSAEVGGTGSALYDRKAGASLKLQGELKNVRIGDPSGGGPKAPVDLQVRVEAAYQTNTLELSQLSVALPPTPRARNEVVLQGRLHLVPTNALTGQVTIRSEALELSDFYDAYATNRPTAAASGSPPPEQEPAPVDLPIQRFVADLKIDRLYLREIIVTNWSMTATLATNILLVDPLQLTLNGAPVAGRVRVDMTRPGFAYEGSLDARNVPLAPVADTLMPTRRGQLGGEVSAKLQLAGVGITGPSLQKNLTGQFEGGSTNLNLALGNVKSSLLKAVLNAVVGVPELIRNPTAALGNLLGQSVGAQPAGSGGWIDEVSQSPIQTIMLRGKAGGGRIDLEQARVQSPAFLVEAQGAITLAPVTTNSTLQIPVGVSLRSELAEKLGLAPAGAATTVAYAKLPDFLSLEGTLGDPRTKLNRTALLGVSAKAGGSLLGNTGNPTLDKASGILNAVGGLLGTGGRPPGTANTNAPAARTNQPPGQAPSPGNLLDLFKKN